MATVTIFKEDYTEAQIAYLRNKYTTFLDSTRVMKLYPGTDEAADIDKISAAANKSEDAFREIFPDFKDRDQREEAAQEFLEDLLGEFKSTLAKMADEGLDDCDTFDRLYTIYRDLQ